jgi:uncharacterized protein involved in exopolysaccharide biosynthesis
MSEERPAVTPEGIKSNQDGDEISVIDILIVLAKRKALVLGLPAAVAFISAGIALLMPNYYAGITKILPPQQTQSTSAVLSQLGNLTGLAGGAATGLKNPNDLYVGMLKSRTVADNLIARFGLNELYEEKYQSSTRNRLARETTITAGKDGIITVQVDDKDPKRAAELANGYVEELFKLTKVLAVTEASQRRLFFERQLEQAKESLAKSEASTREALQKGGLVLVEGQGRVMAETSARLRAEITVKEIQMGAMRTFASDQNPELQRTQQEVAVLRRELGRIEGTSGAAPGRPEGANLKGIENLRLLREMRYNEVTYELLAKQYEIAKIDEAKDSAVIQVMDKAIEPDRKSKPARLQIVLLSTLAAGVLAMLWAFLLEAFRRNNLRSAERWQTLKEHIALRRA